MRKKLISIDFDGVLNSYVSGWQGADQCPDAPVPGAMQFLQSLVADDRFDAVIYSSRCASDAGVNAIRTWLDRHLVAELGEHAGRYVGNRVRVASSKPPAFLAIDDRAITFDGTWPGLDVIDGFVPWNKRTDTAEAAEKAGWTANLAPMLGIACGVPEDPKMSPQTDDRLVTDLVMLLQKAMRKLPADEPFRDEIASFIDRKGIGGSPLRSETTTPPIAWEPEFDAISSEQERLAIEFSNKIAGEYGRPGLRPDPVMILEMAEALYRAERDYVRATPPIATTMTLTTDETGRPIVDGAPAISADEMPEGTWTDEQIEDAVAYAIEGGDGWHTEGERNAAEIGARRVVEYLTRTEEEFEQELLGFLTDAVKNLVQKTANSDKGEAA